MDDKHNCQMKQLEVLCIFNLISPGIQKICPTTMHVDDDDHDDEGNGKESQFRIQRTSVYMKHSHNELDSTFPQRDGHPGQPYHNRLNHVFGLKQITCVIVDSKILKICKQIKEFGLKKLLCEMHYPCRVRQKRCEARQNEARHGEAGCHQRET